MVRLTDRPDMTLDVYRGRKTTMQQQQLKLLLKYCSKDMKLQVIEPGRVAQSVGHLTRKSGVLGSIPGLATYFRFFFRFFQEGQLSVTGESMCTKYWLTA